MYDDRSATVVLIAARCVRCDDFQAYPACRLEQQRAGCLRGAANLALDEIRRSHEVGDEAAARAIVDFLGRTDLLDPAAVHHDHPVGDRQRFLLVVRDVKRGDVQPPLQFPKLHAHLGAQFGVQVR